MPGKTSHYFRLNLIKHKILNNSLKTIILDKNILTMWDFQEQVAGEYFTPLQDILYSTRL